MWPQCSLWMGNHFASRLWALVFSFLCNRCPGIFAFFKSIGVARWPLTKAAPFRASKAVRAGQPDGCKVLSLCSPGPCFLPVGELGRFPHMHWQSVLTPWVLPSLGPFLLPCFVFFLSGFKRSVYHSHLSYQYFPQSVICLWTAVRVPFAIQKFLYGQLEHFRVSLGEEAPLQS